MAKLPCFIIRLGLGTRFLSSPASPSADPASPRTLLCRPSDQHRAHAGSSLRSPDSQTSTRTGGSSLGQLENAPRSVGRKSPGSPSAPSDRAISSIRTGAESGRRGLESRQARAGQRSLPFRSGVGRASPLGDDEAAILATELTSLRPSLWT